jgi:aspartate aminotransferase
MTQESIQTPLSQLAETLIPSEIIKLGNEISERVKQGQKIYNFTIGDFDPEIFPIPVELEDAIVQAYRDKKTNYPPANGILELRKSLANFIGAKLGLEYEPSSFLISGGGRPLIYAAYRTICDKGESVIYPVPSWNNNHYTHFVEGEHICIETKAEHNFLPTAGELIPHFGKATLLALCSPLNPTGTVFSKDQLSRICEAVIEENKSRKPGQKPLYILYDQIYWTLTYGNAEHFNPISLFPELKPYTIFIDGISKAFCATGVRVGWAFGPDRVIDKMKGILSHIGAWSPMAEQVATAVYLENETGVNRFLNKTGTALYDRLKAIYAGIMELKANGYALDAIAPMAAMYLTLRFSIKGKKDKTGRVIHNTSETSAYLLEHASLAIVPFSAFGSDKESEWYRLSVGTCKMEDIPDMLGKLKEALDALT